MKRTNIVIDDKLVSKGKRLTGISTCRGLVDFALRELVRRGNQKKILELRGAVKWDGDIGRMRATRGTG